MSKGDPDGSKTSKGEQEQSKTSPAAASPASSRPRGMSALGPSARAPHSQTPWVRGPMARVPPTKLPEGKGPTPRVPAAPEPAAPAGMGAIVMDGAVYFRVWAPSAETVAVMGTFNEWSHDATPLRHEGDGYWGGRAVGAKVGDEYRYWLRNGDQELSRNDPYARRVTDSQGNSVVTAPPAPEPSPFLTPPWNELVIYELHVGTYHVTAEGKAGTFQSVIERLDHLVDLGVNAIEIMPSAEFPGDFSWGYDLSHPFAVESAYGGGDGLRALVRAAHEKGIAILMDVVFNHLGPMDLDLWRFDGWSENDGGGIYFYNDARSETPWGHTRPDYGRPEVRRYLRDNALMWLEEYQVDGLRADALSYVHNVHGGVDPAFELPDGQTLMRDINAKIRQKYPYKFIVAEDVRGSDVVTSPVEQGGQGFSAQWDVKFVNVLREQLIVPTDEARSIAALAELITDRFNGDPFQRVIYSESHDDVGNGKARLAEAVAPGDANGYHARKRALLGMAFTLTAPGIPMLFQGQGLNPPGTFDGMPPLDWSLREANHGHVQALGDLVRLRRNLTGVSRGLLGQNVAIVRADEGAKVLAFHRWYEGGARDSVVVILNFSANTYTDQTIGLPASGLWKVRFNSDWQGYFPDFDGVPVLDTAAQEGACDGLPFTGHLHLAPYSAVLLSLD
jgi:1,4-alpha-glucan branching enzyme